MDLNNIDDAEKFQRHFVEPLVEKIQAELRPLVEKVNAHDEEIATLKRNQGRALVGFAAIALAVSTGAGLAWGWVRSKLNGMLGI